MDDTRGTSSTPLGSDPDAIEYTSGYVRRLLAEASYIYASLENPGGSVILNQTGIIDADRGYEYSSQIGNSFHLDLIDLQTQMKELSKGERDALVAWANGLTALEASQYLHSEGRVNLADTVRKRRQRGIERLARGFNEQEDKNKKRATSEVGDAGDVSSDSRCEEASA
jgi:hypothetical protein